MVATIHLPTTPTIAVDVSINPKLLPSLRENLGTPSLLAYKEPKAGSIGRHRDDLSIT
jgi:hypothetical protein